MSRIQFALCGSYRADDELNPYKVTESQVHQEILSLINLEPQTLEEIAGALNIQKGELARHLEALGRAGLVERIGPRYKLSFALFTAQDQERLGSLIDELSGSFAEVVQENMDLVQRAYASCGFSDHGFPFGDVAYILVGAYTFDYGGLEALSKADLLRITKEMPGGNYIFTGLEGELKLRANWQWGHSYSFGHFTFFGHGELPAEGPRRAFPEEAYKWLKEGQSEEEVTAVMEDLGQILLALYKKQMKLEELANRIRIEGERLQEHIELLQELEYITRAGDAFISHCPMIGKEALEHIWKLVERFQAKLIAEVLRPNWEQMWHIYEGTAPARNGIDIREGFNIIYHLIFGQALRLLMEQRIVSWPKRRADGARYAVWVQHDTEWEE